MDIKDLFVVISSVLLVIAPIPYIRDILKGKTKPRVVSWLNWALLTAIIATASLSDKQYPAALMAYLLTSYLLIIVVLGWRTGEKQFTAFDIFCQLGVVGCLVLWGIYNSANVAIIAAIFIDFIALMPTLKHAWQKPQEETSAEFILAGIAAFFTLLAAESIKVTSAAFPIYLIFAEAITAGIIIGRGKRLGN